MAEDNGDSNKLSAESTLLVRDEVNKLLMKWLAIAGVTNVLIVAGFAWYLFTAIPDRVAGEAAEKVVEETKNRTANLREELEDEHVEVFTAIGAVREGLRRASSATNEIETSADAVRTRVATLSETLDEIQQADLGSVLSLINNLDGSNDLPEIVSRLADLESLASRLGKQPADTSFSVNGPRIGGADKHTCPQGQFVTGIHASGSVGGKYGVDGISHITFDCSPIL